MLMDKISWVSFQDVVDSRGRLTAIESNVHVPFDIKRVFYVHEVAPGIKRGGHAHLDTNQVLTGIHGSLTVDISDGKISRSYRLESPMKGLYVPSLLWVRLYEFSPGAVCLVFADTRYDQSKSIRDWKEYLDFNKLAFTPEFPDTLK